MVFLFTVPPSDGIMNNNVADIRGPFEVQADSDRLSSHANSKMHVKMSDMLEALKNELFGLRRILPQILAAQEQLNSSLKL